MLSDFLTDFNTAKLQSNLIPKGTIVKVKMAIKPGDYENWFIKSYTTGSIYLNVEFTVTEGPYAKRKIFQIIGVKSGKASVEGEDVWGESGRSMLRSILESARNIHSNDTSEKAVIARKVNSIADFNGLEFTAKVGIEADRYGEKNKIATVIIPEQHQNTELDWIPF
ncbi:putative phage related protein [Wolbachia endosymbiont of Armadillidium vulgare str. wVulC]|uniref:hypothetical protein n=1 Tax=Wolbachia endosymbiont of Armadillidium vulgare TaxID=77039 RepID=UPI00064AFB5F|nr:hypothetical protein [Wolbachia endosymbiont of Armadillidium vulgare]KLT21868.1 putative phage related protein [Wolbachia endosymbiont of Armadillidium vulgare str. wVulC]KLT22785.1 putative phage related protein [Wolbachia endosymbiont of Armadillidium vulgare str. wVulC]